MKSSLQAFTLIELIVVMVLSLITLGAGMAVFEVFTTRFTTFQREYDISAEMAKLNYLLHKDFQEADLVRLQPNGFEIVSAKSAVTYHIDGNHLIRSGAIKDTFRIEISKMTASLKGETVQSAGNIMDELQLEAVVNDKALIYHVDKQYSTAQLLEAGIE